MVQPDSTPAGWDAQTLHQPHARADKAARVQAMFDAIAPTYERVNAVATFGRDAAWRRRAVAAVRPAAGEVLLDVCCGTGDMIRSFALAQPALHGAIGVDFAANMLAAGRYDGCAARVQLIRGDGLRLPVRDAAVDLVSCAFGVRNFQNTRGGVFEMARVLRPGGRVVILEFATPENRLLRWGYRLYCETVLPRLGGLIARDRVGAYKYLPRSIETFETPLTLMQHLRDAGLAEVSCVRMNFGGVALYRGVRPA
ncbi:UbiE/COQ5 methyltransferase [Phycisphaerae bacterium RAS1]|nr:UbiE/COQ5 methyltransferase [Phycisphaerae bacterium RAS1]